MSYEWQKMENAPKDRRIMVAGGEYQYSPEEQRFRCQQTRTVQFKDGFWYNVGFGTITTKTDMKMRIEHPKWWIDLLPPVPTE